MSTESPGWAARGYRQTVKEAGLLSLLSFLVERNSGFNTGGFEVLGCRTVAAVRSWVTHGH